MIQRAKYLQGLLVVLATLCIVKLSIAISSSSPSYEWFDPLIDVRGMLVDRHLQDPDQEAMQNAVIEAMIESLDDPYALFVPDDKEDAFIKDLEGDYAGIGAEVRMVDGNLTIITPMEHSPALAAGVQAGDIVEMIDNEPAKDATINALIDRLTGPVGTEVVLDVTHKDGSTEQLTVVRGHIKSQSVTGLVRRNQEWSWCLDDVNGIAYIRIRQFLDTTPQELLDAIQLANDAVPIKGLVLDLRENPGGSLPAAITIANMFLEEGTIVSVSGRRTEARSWDAQPDTMLSDVPMLVLVNNTSASASEIVSGSLQAHGRAAVLGMRTFGKGSVQEVMELASGGMLKFTTARYDLANGRTIDKRLSEDSGLWGVDPNSGLVIRETQEETLDRIRSREPYTVITQDEPDDFQCGDRTWIQEVLKDVQLAEGMLAMQTYLDSREWPSLSDEDPVLAGITEEMTELAKERIEILKSLVDIDKQLSSLQGEVIEDIVIPDEVNSDNATITLTDEEGNVIGSWEVSRGDVKGALQSLHLKQSSQE